MTANQIEYAKHLETIRHNVETEAQGRADVASRQATAQAAVSQAATAERSQQETARHNLVAEAVSQFSAQHTALYQDRTGRASLQQAQAASTTAAANMLNAQTRQAELSESIRHNMAQESEAYRSHTASEAIASATLSETKRHNLAGESQAAAELTERQRHQQAVESEQHRTNVENELIRQQQADAASQQAFSSELRAWTGVFDSGWGALKDVVGALFPTSSASINGSIFDIPGLPF